jgi:hypothetical protein
MTGYDKNMREMESQIATFEDASLILKLYDLRREAVLRQARRWLVIEFNPATAEEFLAMTRTSASQENAYFRQVLSYWEMAASLVLHGAVKADLFLASNGEGIYLFAKFNQFRDEYQAKMGRPFMRQTAQMVEKYPMAREIFTNILKSIQSRAS